MEPEIKITVTEFLSGREGLSEERITMLRYLGSVSDVCWVIPIRKGRSLIKCEFDCGAYKGSEVLTFRIANLNPFSIAASLMALTSGHHFSFPEPATVLLGEMQREANQRRVA